MNTTKTPRAVGQTAHTPTPWRVNLDSVISESGLHICAVDGYGMTGEQNAANRAFIVTACNSHATLVSALKRVVELCDDEDADEMTREAASVARLALAKSTTP